jgi:cyclase
LQQLTDNVVVFIDEHTPNPSAVITSEGVVMVDAPERPVDIYAWKEEILKHGQPKYLINCEHHGDHIIGNWFFAPPAIVVSHQGTRDLFASSLKSAQNVRERNARMYPGTPPIPDDYQLVPPNLTYTDQLNIFMGDQEIQVIHMAGHTPNQTVVWVPKEGVMMAGGNISREIMPAMWGSEILNWLDSLDRMIALEPRHIVPVHGPLADLPYLKRFRDYIGEWVQDVRAAIAKGWSTEETGKGITRWLAPEGPFRMRYGREPYGPEWMEWCTVAIYEELRGLPRTKRTYFAERPEHQQFAATLK